jgi:hypothetical protein
VFVRCRYDVFETKVKGLVQPSNNVHLSEVTRSVEGIVIGNREVFIVREVTFSLQETETFEKSDLAGVAKHVDQLRP